MPNNQSTNALALETSPYLLQHAHNPVNWFPWSEQALAQARSENKPILLSIGYSACHWCHVMAHESFEDEETARLMNEHFINVKVDREERPDLDKIYQLAHQLLTQRAGGWPLTMFLTSDDQTPFFAGTYFPKEPRFGMPAFKDLLLRVVDFYEQNQDGIKQQNASLVKALSSLEPQPGDAGARITSAPLESAYNQLRSSFDEANGGFGAAPKFPHPTNLERLLRHYAATQNAGKADEAALHMVSFTLHKMALGGLYDQLGGGFCRYSVDDYWMIPHFEKMLYDNGPLLSLNADAWQVTRHAVFERVVRETAEWVVREMQSSEGGYYSTLDADSEGEEGKFYRWTLDEVRELLSDEELRVWKRRFGLDRAPNFEGQYWHFHVFVESSDLARELALEPSAVHELLAAARAKLFQNRDTRVKPGRDEKILAAWNGLMIKGMAKAGHVLEVASFIDSAERAVDFVRDTLWQEGRLLATYKDGRARFNAYLDDYAFIIDGILSLLEARWRDGDVDFAVELAEVLLRHYQDTEHGGFYFTADDHETLIHRPKPMMDDALPSGNGVAAHALARLGHVLGEVRYLEAAESTIRAGWSAMTQYPHACNALLLAAEEYLYPPQTIVLRGEPTELEQWGARCSRYYAPRRLTLKIPTNAKALPGLLATRAFNDRAIAYVCEGHRCDAPITALSELDRVLQETEVSV